MRQSLTRRKPTTTKVDRVALTTLEEEVVRRALMNEGPSGRKSRRGCANAATAGKLRRADADQKGRSDAWSEQISMYEVV
jgi:hypothetical protein